MLECHRAHRSEGGVLHHDEDQWVAEEQEERGNQKDDRFDMIPEQRDTFDRHLEPSMDELPEGLDVIGEIEGPVFKVRPAGVGRPGANGEEDQREAENRSFARISREPICRGHGPCLIPGGRRQTSLSGRRR